VVEVAQALPDNPLALVIQRPPIQVPDVHTAGYVSVEQHHVNTGDIHSPQSSWERGCHVLVPQPRDSLPTLALPSHATVSLNLHLPYAWRRLESDQGATLRAAQGGEPAGGKPPRRPDLVVLRAAQVVRVVEAQPQPAAGYAELHGG
jgi:hypothetical protein